MYDLGRKRPEVLTPEAEALVQSEKQARIQLAQALLKEIEEKNVDGAMVVNNTDPKKPHTLTQDEIIAQAENLLNPKGNEKIAFLSQARWLAHGLFNNLSADDAEQLNMGEEYKNFAQLHGFQRRQQLFCPIAAHKAKRIVSALLGENGEIQGKVHETLLSPSEKVNEVEIRLRLNKILLIDSPQLDLNAHERLIAKHEMLQSGTLGETQALNQKKNLIWQELNALDAQLKRPKDKTYRDNWLVFALFPNSQEARGGPKHSSITEIASSISYGKNLDITKEHLEDLSHALEELVSNSTPVSERIFDRMSDNKRDTLKQGLANILDHTQTLLELVSKIQAIEGFSTLKGNAKPGTLAKVLDTGWRSHVEDSSKNSGRGK